MKVAARLFYIQFFLAVVLSWQPVTAQPSFTASGEITGVATADEGATFTLTAPTVSGGSGTYSYRWTQTAQDPTELSGRSELVLASTNTATLSVSIPADFIAADATTGSISFMLVISDGSTEINRSKVVEIQKIDNGAPDIALDVNSSRLSIVATSTDPDGAGNFSYDWQKKDRGEADWTTVSTETTYWLPSGASGSIRYRVDVGYTDGQGNKADYSQEPFILTPFRADIDDDDDGLIEIYYLEDLDAVRHSLDGSGYKASAAADLVTDGCAEGGNGMCRGYELATNLDFNDARSYTDSDNNQANWTANDKRKNAGWVPLGALATTLEGNGYTISNLYINSRSVAGLFRASNVSINNVGLLDVDIRGGDPRVGGLMGNNAGKITGSHVTGNVTGTKNIGMLAGRNNSAGEIINSYASGNVTGTFRVGGMVGNNEGTIANSYAINKSVISSSNIAGGLVGQHSGQITNTYTAGTVNAPGNAGGLLGIILSTGSVKYSYTISTVTGSQAQVGGLVPSVNPSADDIVASYWDSSVYERAVPRDDGRVRTTEALQSPTEAGGTMTEIYYGWSSKNWDFGDENSYPALRYGVGDEDNPACDEDDATALPRCGFLLSGQPGRDRGLNAVFFLFADEEIAAKINPSFSTVVFDYDVTIPDPDAEITKYIATLQLRPYTINDATTIAITNEADASNRDYFVGKESGDISGSIMLDDNTTITIVVTDTIDEGTVNTTYTLAINRLVLPLEISAIKVSSDPSENADDSINEGSKISFAVKASGGRDNYEYALQIADNPQLPFQQNLPLEFEVAEDLLGVNVTTQNYTFKVIVRSADLITSQTEVLTIRKIDNGTPAIALDVNPSRLSIATGTDPDGAGDFSYDWQKRDRGEADWTTVATTATYWLPSGASGSIRYRVNVEHTDGQGYEADYSQVPFILTPFRADIDDDDDGLIEIWYLEDLDAVRHSLDGSSYKASADADLVTVGCAEDGNGNCSGYELATNLDFNDVQSYTNSDNQANWTANDNGTASWVPIGTSSAPLAAILEGNGYTISNLYINFTGKNAGLFGVSSVSINNIGLLDVDIRSNGNTVGGLASINDGKITDSYATGQVGGRNNLGLLVGLNGSTGEIINSYVRGSVGGNGAVGGMVGDNRGAITNSYALNNQVTGANTVGGLVGANTGEITNTYATGTVEGRKAGGLAGELKGSGVIKYSYTISTVSGNQIGGLVASIIVDNIVASYWDSDVSSSLSPSNNDRARTTEALQSPTDATGIYSEWSSKNWDFGDASSYPTLRYGEGSDEENPACDSDDATRLPQCGVLLSGQQDRDRGLAAIFFLSANEEIAAKIDPSFSTVVFDYDVTIPDSDTERLQLRLHAINDAATITITKAGDASNRNYFIGKENGETSNPIRLDDNTTITIVVADKINEGTVNTTYTLVITHLMPLQISAITVTPKNADNTINEGSELSLRPEVSGGSDNYEYALQIADNPSLSFQQNLPLEFEVAEDLLGTDVTTQNYTFKVIVRDGDLITSRTEVLTIRKIDNGTPAITLDINPSRLSIIATGTDPDGAGDFSYDWQKRDIGEADWTTVSTTATYWLPNGASGSIRYRVDVRYTDGQGNEANYSQEPFILTPFRADIDDDDDGLIEIYYLEDLDAVRYSLDGSSYKTSADADLVTVGCAEDGNGSCSGYELATNLDFKDTQSYTDSDNQANWAADNNRRNAGWVPLGALDTTLEGNGYTISNLYINPGDSNVGLFSSINASINNIGLLNVDIRGNTVGGLASVNNGKITDSYVTGQVEGQNNVGLLIGRNGSSGEIINSYVVRGSVTGNRTVGGLVGDNRGAIANSYSRNKQVMGSNTVGGLVGSNTGEITNTYATGAVEGKRAGGLAGTLEDSGMIKYSYTISTVSGNQIGGLVASIADSDNIVASYWDSDVSSLRSSNDTAKTTVALQSPTTATGIYSAWSSKNWDFGDASSYPALRYAVGSDEDNPACDEDAETELSPCGVLLPGQQGRDKGLATLSFLSADEEITARVVPSFSVSAFDYAVTIPDPDTGITELYETIRLRLQGLNAMPVITITKAGDATNRNYFAGKASGGTSDPIRLDDNTTITVVVADSIADDTVNTTYTLVITRLMPLQISAITVTPKNADNTINEGSDLSLAFNVTGGSGDYEYTVQVEGEPLQSFSQAPPFNIKVREDLLDAAVTTQNRMLKVIVRDSASITSRTEVVTIKKIDNGAATFDTTLTVNGSQLSITVQNISDEDGVGAFTYQWQKRNVNSGWQDIMNATAADYTVPMRDTNDSRYRVQVTHTDAQGYEDTVLEGPSAYRSDVDADDDGLIEIYYLEDLDAVRYSLTEGCDDGTGNCSGYELATNLDFKDALSYTDNDNMAKWTANGDTNRGWVPIDSLATTFNGNGYTISNLYINSTAAAGLFSGSSVSINDVGLLDVDVRGTTRVGGLTATNTGKITNSYVTGRVVGHSLVGMLVGFNNSGEIFNSYAGGSVTGSLTVVGGLVGGNSGKITDTYAAVAVTGQRSVGGLVGAISGAGIVQYSYTIGTVIGPQDQVGGLAASVPNADDIVASYWDSDVYASSGVSLPPADATSRTTAALQSPTTATGIYSEWSSENWDFGSESSYPALRYGVGDENDPACDADDATALPRCGFLLPGQPGIERTISVYIKILLEGLLR